MRYIEAPDLLTEVKRILADNPQAGRYTVARALGISEKKARRLLQEARRGDVPKAFPAEEARKQLARGPVPLSVLAKALRRGERETAAALEDMRGDGFDIRELPDGRLYLNRAAVAEYGEVETPYYGNTIRFGIVTDTHLSSRAEKLDELREFYRLAKALGIREIVHAGDIVAGVNMYPGQMHEVLPGHYGYDAQLNHVVEDYPREDGITTYLISGNHDASFIKAAGANICAAVSYRRPDIEYVGAMSGRVILGGILKVDLIHPDGGMPYARSYRAQKINEGYGRNNDTPHILVLGHLHVAGYLPYLGIHEIQGGCFEGQTAFLRRKGIFPEIGGWIVEANIDDGRVNRLQPEWISF